MIFTLLHYTAVTVLQVPYNALGFEMSPDYRDRTRVFAYRTFFAQIAKFILPGLFYLCQLPIFHGDAMEGVKWVGAATGLTIILFMLPTVTKVREGQDPGNGVIALAFYPLNEKRPTKSKQSLKLGGRNRRLFKKAGKIRVGKGHLSTQSVTYTVLNP